MTRLLILGFFLAGTLSAGGDAQPHEARAEGRAGKPQAGVSYLLVRTETGVVLEADWEQLEKPIPLGSLVKPFTALAYAATHSFSYPRSVCTGTGCWLPQGHGNIGIRPAIANSCNAYFRQLADHLTPQAVQGVSRRFGLAAPATGARPVSYVGLGNEWPMPPLSLARAYAELVRRSSHPGVHPLLQGLARSAREGTGQGVGRALRGEPALVKTGTAPCIHRTSNGDGYVLILYPAATPRYTLLVQVHGVPGRRAADLGGRILADRLLHEAPQL